MKRLKLKKLLNKFVKLIPIILIISVALVLRFYNLEKRTAFDADQEEIATRTQELLSGHPVLLGPKTSLGGFSIGPGFIYLSGFFTLLTKNDPIAGAYASVFSGIIFIVLIYLFFLKIFSERTARIVSLICAVSTTLIFWDQNPWAPSIFYPAELLVIYGAFISDKKPIGLPITFLGLVIGFQAHFAIFLVLPALAIFWLIYRPMIIKRYVYYSLLILFLGLLPNIIFDLTHHFVNFERLISVFKLAVAGSSPPINKIVMTLITNSVNLYFMFLPENLRIAIFALSVLFCSVGITRDLKFRKILILTSLFIIVPFIFFLFYRSNFSEYYLMSVLPPYITLTAYIFEKVKKYTFFIIVLAVILVFINLKLWKTYIKTMNMSAKKEAVQTIVGMGGKSGYGVSLSVDLGYRFGYPFLFKYFGANPDLPPAKNQKKIYTIIVPPGYGGIEPFRVYDGIGLRWEGI